MSDDLSFEWDDQKRRSNIAKHGLDFVDAARIFMGDYKNWQSDAPSEPRWIAVGVLEGVEIAIIFTVRDRVIRIVSARRASRDERRKYYADDSDAGERG